MTAYDLAAWTDFANTVAGGAAALAGLFRRPLAEPVRSVEVPGRAIARRPKHATNVRVISVLLHANPPSRVPELILADYSGSATRLATTTISGGSANSTDSIAT